MKINSIRVEVYGYGEVVGSKTVQDKLNYRQAAYVIAVERIIKALNMRGF